jgi:hypothetical protein
VLWRASAGFRVAARSVMCSIASASSAIFDQTLHHKPLVGGHLVRAIPEYAAYPSGVPGFELFRRSARGKGSD